MRRSTSPIKASAPFPSPLNNSSTRDMPFNYVQGVAEVGPFFPTEVNVLVPVRLFNHPIFWVNERVRTWNRVSSREIPAGQHSGIQRHVAPLFHSIHPFLLVSAANKRHVPTLRCAQYMNTVRELFCGCLRFCMELRCEFAVDRQVKRSQERPGKQEEFHHLKCEDAQAAPQRSTVRPEYKVPREGICSYGTSAQNFVPECCAWSTQRLKFP